MEMLVDALLVAAEVGGGTGLGLAFVGDGIAMEVAFYAFEGEVN